MIHLILPSYFICFRSNLLTYIVISDNEQMSSFFPFYNQWVFFPKAFRNLFIDIYHLYRKRKMFYFIQKRSQFFLIMVFFHMNRSEEHTSELQSRFDLVCRLLLE